MTVSGDGSLAGEARVEVLASVAESLRGRGYNQAEIAIRLRDENSRRCRPPLSHCEVGWIVAIICVRETGEETRRPSTAPRECKAIPRANVGRRALAKKARGAKAKRVGGFDLTPLEDLMAEPKEEASWLVEGMLPAAGTSVVVAKPKVGKTTAVRQLAVSVARGRPFLGRETTAGPVIYLALEEKRAEVREHFRAMGALCEDIYIHCGISPKNGVAKLRRLVERIRPALVIVDPLFLMARVDDANNYAKVSAALEPLMAIARETGAHILAVHHMGKGERSGGDSILGSTAILGTVDTAVLMRRGDSYRTIRTVQRYGADLEETVLDFDAETRTVSLGESKEQVDERGLADEMLEVLQGRDVPLTEEKVLAEAEGKTGAKRTALRQLVKAGKVERLGEGKRGSPFLYLINSRFPVPGISGERENGNSESGKNPPQHWQNSRSREDGRTRIAECERTEFGPGIRRVPRRLL